MTDISSSIVVNKNKQIAITAALSALIILMGIPGLHLGFIQISPTASLTIMHIPVLLAGFLAGLPGGLVTGFIFGLTSLINAAVNPSGVLDPLFVNPLCSVFPRLVFGACAWFVYKMFEKIPHLPPYINAAISALVASLIHSFVVIGSMYVFLHSKMLAAMDGTGYFVVMGMILPGTMMEAVVGAIVCTFVVGSITVVDTAHSKLFSDEELNGSDSEEDKKDNL